MTGSSRLGAGRRSRSTRSGTTHSACSTAGFGSMAAGTVSISPSHAQRAREAFNARFWYAEGGYLYDVVDGEHGDDPACRPNQVFAISLDHPVLAESRWEAVLNVVQSRLLTPVGLRSLAPGHPDYKAEVLRRPPVARRRLPSGNRMGLADWPLRGRVAEAAPRGPRGSARAPRWFRGAP